MITINKTKKFAKNSSEITDSIFQSKTCVGFYKERKGKKDIILFDHECAAIAVLWRDSSGNWHAGNCKQVEPGKFFIQAGISEAGANFIGWDDTTYTGNMVEVSNA